VRFTTSLDRSSVVLVTAEGEIDAANALALGKYVEAELESVSRLVVDLRALDFFGTQGFSILHRINVMCSRHAANWVVLAGTEVNRVLHICDPDGGLPVAESFEGAIATVIRPPRSHLRLVTIR
jgi:anti-anti-sigma factor